VRFARYMGYRLVTALPVILGIIVLNFLLIHLAPGDAASVLAGESGAATPEYMDALRHQFGLDQSLGVQFLTYISNMAHFSLGYSYRNDADVSGLILERLGPTSLLMLTAFGTAVALGIVLGMVAATGRNSWRDNIISLISLVAYDTVGAGHQGWAEVQDVGRHLVMPAVSLALFYLALYARLMRASILEQTGMDYVTTARAKGQTERRIMTGHVLRNALLPVVTLAGVQAGNLIGGSIVVETVFGWPGIGTLAFNALQSRDLNLLLAIFFISACLVVIVNFAVDVISFMLDPRMEI
jgi:peptide/nickel transport system permease protein